MDRERSFTSDPSQLHREVRTLASVQQHAHVIRLLELHGSRTRLYLVLELAGGGDLFDRIVACGTLTEAAAAKAMRELCRWARGAKGTLPHPQGARRPHGTLSSWNPCDPAIRGGLKVADALHSLHFTFE